MVLIEPPRTAESAQYRRGSAAPQTAYSAGSGATRRSAPALEVAVLHRVPRLDHDVGNAVGLRPGHERLSGETPRAVVGSLSLRVSLLAMQRRLP